MRSLIAIALTVLTVLISSSAMAAPSAHKHGLDKRDTVYSTRVQDEAGYPWFRWRWGGPCNIGLHVRPGCPSQHQMFEHYYRYGD
jgi:hypothetical protein